MEAMSAQGMIKIFLHPVTAMHHRGVRRRGVGWTQLIVLLPTPKVPTLLPRKLPIRTRRAVKKIHIQVCAGAGMYT